MHITRLIADDTYYLGGSDRRLSLFENIYPLSNGISYNSYFINDEKTCILDTVDHSISELFFENLSYLLKGRKLDYLVIDHMEPDHAAEISNLILRHPDVTVVLNAKSLTMLKNFFREMDFDKLNTLVVKEGDVLDLGKHKLTFVMAPMVHWPEVMFTYDSTSKVLFTADAFGTFNALHGNIFMDEYDWKHEFLEEFRRYYINIVGKYGPQVQMALKKAAGIEINTIAPLHGPIIRTKEDISKVLSLYNTWSTYTPEEKGVLIAYASIYGHTENVANAVADKLSIAGVKNIHIYDISKTDVSYLVSDAFKYSHLICLSASYNALMFPKMEQFLLDIKAHNYQKRTIALVENGTWAPAAYNHMMKIVETLPKCEVYQEKITVPSTPTEDNLEQLDNLIEFIKNSLESN